MAIVLAGCAQDQARTRWGAVAGAVTGALVGSQAGGDREKNVLIGALIGAGIGAAIGNYLDKKEKELKKAFADEVTIERPAKNQLIASFSDSLPFDTGSAKLSSRAYPILQQLAQILKDSDGVRLVITGHTDNVGDHLANQRLSERRAETVAKALVQMGQMSPGRVALRGAGEMAPVADNNIAAGRAINRRVDVLILPMTDPIPPVHFTMAEDTEPEGQSLQAGVQTMRLHARKSGHRLPLGNRQGRLVENEEKVPRGKVSVKEVVRKKPHLYSPIRTVEELLSA